MKTRIPLGETEDLHLEFKSAESLKKPEAIGREVAAMLNSDGGEVWIGLGERDSVAVELQAIPGPEKAAGSLLDSLVDRLEPSPLPGEVRVEAVPAGEDMSIIRVRVQAGARGPYALLNNGGRYYQRRVGGRLLPMSREEIFGRSRDRQLGEDRLTNAKQRLLEARESAQQTSRQSLWLRIEPVEPMGIDIQSTLFEEWLLDPEKTGNRRSGWHFIKASVAPRLRRERISWNHGDALAVDISADGMMSFLASLESLQFRKGEDQEIWPIKLLEYPISAFRLARVVLEPSQSKSDIVADLALFGIRGWKLRPGSIINNRWRFNDPVEYSAAEDDLTSTNPLVFRFEELMNEPDRCGFRLIRRIYEAFGYREDELPREYDWQSGRLILPG